jgi:hypothetical protein
VRLPLGVVPRLELLHRFRASTLLTTTWNVQQAGLGFVEGFASPEECRDKFVKSLAELHKECKHAGLESICTHIEVVNRSLKPDTPIPYLVSHGTTILGVLQSTLTKTLIYRLDEQGAELLVQESGLTPDAISSFPSARREFVHAARCLAFDESTAAVFHSMRAIEFGIRALVKALNISPTNPNWENIINDCEKAIKDIGPTLGADWKDKKQFYSEAAVNFRFFKDAWRNHTMHAGVSYDRTDGKQILEHSQLLIEKISQRIGE